MEVGVVMRIFLIISGVISLILSFSWVYSRWLDMDDAMNPNFEPNYTPTMPVLISWAITGILWLVSGAVGTKLDGIVNILDIILFPFAWVIDVCIKATIWIFSKFGWVLLHPFKAFGIVLVLIFVFTFLGQLFGGN